MTNLNLDRIHALESRKLGQDAGSLALETSLDNKAASLSLLEQASKTIDILCYDMEAKIYNSREMYNRFRQFATLNRHSQIRILMHTAKPMVLQGHMLTDLIQRLTSSIFVRRLCALDQSMNQGFLIADKTGYILRPEATRYEGYMDYDNRYVARELSDIFDAAWHRAETEPELRRLHI